MKQVVAAVKGPDLSLSEIVKCFGRGAALRPLNLTLVFLFPFIYLATIISKTVDSYQ